LENIFLKKLLSFLWPITQKVASEINGDVEITWYQGKKLLDTKNANFSYGSLDLILEEAFKYTHIKQKDTVLILGLGGGNFIKKIQQDFLHTGKITAVELDKEIIRIAKDEFGINTNDKIEIFHQDAAKFIKNTKNTYDFIFVDIFVDNLVPDFFYSTVFWNSIYSVLKPKGRFLFNAGILLKNATKLDLIVQSLDKKMILFKKEGINKTNTLLFGEKS